MKRLKNYLSPSTECWEIATEVNFMASVMVDGSGSNNSDLNGVFTDMDWEDL